MSNEFMREERYIVFKMSDLGNSLKGDEIRRLAREYAEQRRLKGKKPLECVVVEKDWPEYEPTWKAIEARVVGAQAQPEPSVPEGWQLVPLEPTAKIRKAMHYAYWQRQSPQMPYHDGSPELWNAAYAAMLAAAPKPEGAQ